MATIESNPPIGVIDPLDGTEEALVLQAGVLKRNPFADLWTWIKGKIESVTLAITLSGGSLNNAPVGATTPSTGAFTTLSASGEFTNYGIANLARGASDIGNKILRLGVTPADNGSGSIEILSSNTNYNWAIRTNWNISNAIEFCPSTAAGSTTFSSPVATISSTGLAVTGAISTTTTIKTGGYTVATLPAGTSGMRTYVTDATTPTWNAALTGGGAVVCPVFYNGTAWVSA